MLLDFGKDAIRVAAGDAVNGLLVILSQHGETRAWPGRRMAYSPPAGPNREWTV